MFFHMGYLVTFLCSIGTVPCTYFQQGDLDASRMISWRLHVVCW